MGYSLPLGVSDTVRSLLVGGSNTNDLRACASSTPELRYVYCSSRRSPAITDHFTTYNVNLIISRTVRHDC